MIRAGDRVQITPYGDPTQTFEAALEPGGHGQLVAWPPDDPRIPGSVGWYVTDTTNTWWNPHLTIQEARA